MNMKAKRINSMYLLIDFCIEPVLAINHKESANLISDMKKALLLLLAVAVLIGCEEKKSEIPARISLISIGR